MPARWMQAKLIKRAKERRAWARPLSVKSGIQPNRDVIAQYQRTAKGLGEEEARTRFPNVAPGRKDINDRIDEILQHFDDPLFFCVLDNNFHRVRVYFNSRRNSFILQWVNWKERVVRISIIYTSQDRARQLWEQDRVTWKVKRNLPPQ